MVRSAAVIFFFVSVLLLSIMPEAGAQQPPPSSTCPAQPDVVYLPQGSWSCQNRQTYYTMDQGAQMIPLAWIEALNHPDGTSFLADKLARYGYLADPQAVTGLPVGFTVAPTSQGDVMGMTCSACHTRQIQAAGKTYRIDGGPAIVDFQGLLRDLDNAVLAVLASDAAFQPFAKTVLGANYPKNVPLLKAEVSVWSARFDTLMANALPKAGWGPSRLDAVGMIFNRLTGLDLGPAPTYLIPGNIQVADAPVRYPFLWNAPIQNFTQWPGFASNGYDILGLARNVGEVYGVFGTFHPTPQSGFFSYNLNYIGINSANFENLWTLEDTIRQLGPPAWPFGTLDPKLVADGEKVFNKKDIGGSCADCHGIVNVGIVSTIWNTPVVDVHTDTRETTLLSRMAESGVMSGADSTFFSTIKPNDMAYNILKVAVGNSITQHVLSGGASFGAVAARVGEAPMAENMAPQPRSDLMKALAPRAETASPSSVVLLSPELGRLQSAFRPIGRTSAARDLKVSSPNVSATLTTPTAVYESRVLQGIWAAAPYLHNGSVPTLADLLKIPPDRPKAFKIGPNYDTAKAGLATDQTAFDYTLQTTGCDELGSGNSNCGHNYGTHFTDDEKKALLEYLKSL